MNILRKNNVNVSCTWYKPLVKRKLLEAKKKSRKGSVLLCWAKYALLNELRYFLKLTDINFIHFFDEIEDEF